MEVHRSKPYGDEKLQMESYKPTSINFRPQTFSYGSSHAYGPPEQKGSSFGNKASSNPNHFRSQSVANDFSRAYGGPTDDQQKERSFGSKPSSNPNHLRSQSVAYDFSYAYDGPEEEQKESSYGYGYNKTKSSSSNPHHSRSQSTVSYHGSSRNYAYNGAPQMNQIVPVKDLKLKKAQSMSVSGSKSWGLSDPEFQRKKRVASYKAYSVEGKVKGSLRKSFGWIKNRYTQVINGLW